MSKNDLSPVTEKLNNAVISRMVGHTNVVYYNFETNAWNRNTYNGYKIDDQEEDTETALAFKAAMENVPKFSQHYEMAAIVTMTIEGKFFPGWGKTISRPVYSDKGTAVVGNIIVKNKTTGKYEWYAKLSVGVDDLNNPNIAVSIGANRFAYFGARDSAFRRRLHRAHTR